MMTDEDERQTETEMNPFDQINNRRLATIQIKLQELTREKTKYNAENLIQVIEVFQSELGDLSHHIAELSKEIYAQIQIRKTLHAKKAILRSNSALRYTNKEMALRKKEIYEKESEKMNKSEVYKDLARRHIRSICEALPQLEIEDKYNQTLQQAEEIQIAAQNKREKLQENLNAKSRKQAEFRQLLDDSVIKLPELEAEIENLRLERDQILRLLNEKRQRGRSSPIPVKSSLELDTLEYEKRHANEQLEKIRLLFKYFHEKLAEHNLIMNNDPELKSPSDQPITPAEERTILSSYLNEQDPENSSSTNESTVPIAMKLPTNLLSSDQKCGVITNEIIHSTHHPQTSIEYKKELPSDILDKYAGTTNKKQQSKKSRKNKKNFGIKHSSQMIVLYNDVQTSSGNSGTLPFLPLFDYELLPTIKALQLMEQSIQLYLTELSERQLDHLPNPIDEEHSEILDDDDDDRRDSALDTFSEVSSLIEPIDIPKDSILILPQLINIPEARSSSSSDDKKTIVSSASPPSSQHSHSKTEHPPPSTSPLTTVEELPAVLPPLTIEIAQIERQISDEGYRSIRNEKQQQQTSGTSHSPLLVHSTSCAYTEKVDQWLLSTTPPLSTSTTDQNFHLHDDHPAVFQSTDISHKDREEDLVESSSIPVSNQ